MNQLYAIFHLNLAFSSISEKKRPTVIERCYWPLLKLIESTNIPFGIELTGWTLQHINEISPQWVENFKSLIAEGETELIGSGYTQMIGPLVPYEVNVWNQRLGLEDYSRLLDATPSLALVNEMAFSTSMVNLYKDAGYKGLVMDQDNIRLALGLDQSDSVLPCTAKGLNDASMPVLWSDSILFQKFQRFAHGDCSLKTYIDYLRSRTQTTDTPLPIYCNDVEVFDFRPGRFKEESTLNESNEWDRITLLVNTISSSIDAQWMSPSQALKSLCDKNSSPPTSFTSIHQPLPVKKQAKYNISRWAISGRDDLWLNSACHKLARKLTHSKTFREDASLWRSLCELWASDLRTHITTERWNKTMQELATFAKRINVDLSSEPVPEHVTTRLETNRSYSIEGVEFIVDDDEILMTIKSKYLELVINLHKGLSIHSLAFASQNFVPVIGTLPHGYFNSIELGADYYTGLTVIELVKEHRRITDLCRMQPHYCVIDDQLIISGVLDTTHGIIEKQISIELNKEGIGLKTSFPGWERPYGTVRVGTLTLMPSGFNAPLSIKFRNGGKGDEAFILDHDCRHAGPSSTLVSCTTGLGATDGKIIIGDDKTTIAVSWNPAKCAAFPMLIHTQSTPAPLTRIVFSLSELDETFREGGNLLPFSCTISPNLDL